MFSAYIVNPGADAAPTIVFLFLQRKVNVDLWATGFCSVDG